MSAIHQFNQDFNALSNYLRGFAMKLTKDKSYAEDLFQETALSAYRYQYKQEFKQHSNLKAWLSTIMKNTFINQYRKNKRRNELQDGTDGSYFLNSINTAVKNEGEIKVETDELTNLIDNLDDSYRIPFLMAYQGYQYNEIQDALGDVPLGTIKSRIHHARRILKNQIQALYN